MSIIVKPKTVITLSEFLKMNRLTLLVRETGASKWEASFDPEVLEDSGAEDDEGDPVFARVSILEESTLKAIQDMCEFLSGHGGLCVEDKDCPTDLDLEYTRVECDYAEAPKIEPEAEPDTSSLLKGLRRHHGGGE